MLYVGKKIGEKDEKKGSAMPPGHCAELNFSILFTRTWEKIVLKFVSDDISYFN